MGTKTKQLVPMTFVADIARSIAFYEHLGFAVGNTFTLADRDEPTWEIVKFRIAENEAKGQRVRRNNG